jgi:hypothetical protein
MPMDPEERELQIMLAKFQVDIQILLAASFGFYAVSAAFFIAAYQIALTSKIDFLAFLFFALFTLTIANVLLRKLNMIKRKLGNLK